MTPKNSSWMVPGILIVLYAVVRTQGITALPIFSDEAIYIHWAQIINSQPTEFLISKVDGKQPLFFWLNAVTLNIFADPLIAGRCVSLMAGGASVLGIYLIGRTLFSAVSGFLAGVIAVFCPYLFFFDRLALVDGLLSALGIWAFLIALLLALEMKSLQVGFRWLGILLGLALLTKATALLLFPVVLTVFYLWEVHHRPGFWKHLATAGCIVLAINLVAFLGGPEISVQGRVPFLHQPDYFIPPAELMSFPWLLWLRNVRVIRDFYVSYLTFPVVMILLAGIIYFIRDRDKKEMALWFWFIIPTGVIVLVANGFFSRYMVMMVPPLLLLTARTLERLVAWLAEIFKSRLHWEVQGGRRHSLLAISLIITLLPSGIFDWRLMREPRTAPLNELDRLLYIEGANSGYGVRAAAEFLRQEARAFKEKKGYAMPLLVAASPGNPAEGVLVYLWNDPSILKVPAYWWPQTLHLIPRENRFSLRPSIYQSTPAIRREAHLLDHARFIYPYTTIPQDKFLRDNPKFKKVWSFIKPDPKYSIDIFKNYQALSKPVQ